MPTTFPSSLDNFTNPTSADDLNTPAVLHSDQHANNNDAIEAIEAWVGISGTAATPSHEYRIKQLENTPPGGSAFGVAGQDEGVPLGTGAIFNVVGDGVVLSRSGTVLMLSHTNPPFPQEVIGVMGWDEGVPLGTGSVLNVVGNNISLSLSGNVLQLLHTDTSVTFPQEVIGIMGQDEGVPLGTGTTLNVVGDNIDISLSGTVLRISHTNPVIAFPQELIGVMGWDDGAPKGTGTVIDFGNNLTATLSGTVLRIDATAGGGSFSGVDQIGVWGQNKGIILGTGTTLNVNGTRLSLTLSGTTLELSNSPDPVELIGMMGSGLGTGTILSVSGGRLSMTLTGSSLNIISSPEPMDNIGIMAFDDAASVGTGTSVSFGSNLTVVRTGTVLFVDAAAGGGGGGAIGLMGQDEGINVGTGTRLNVVGSDIVLSLSGTVLMLSHTNPPFPQDGIGIFGKDEGVSQGTGTILNVVGENISLSLSGTTLTIDHTNPTITFPQEVIGVMGQLKGVPLGTGTTINVNGTRLTASLSGTVLELSNSPDPVELIGMFGSGLGTGTILSVSGGRLSMTLTGSSLNIISSPDPQELIGIYGLANGVPLGTGTWLDFGNNLTASLSGTVLRIDASASASNPPVTGSIVIRDEGSTLGSATILDFVGGGVSTSINGGVARIFVSGAIVFGGSDPDFYIDNLTPQITGSNTLFNLYTNASTGTVEVFYNGLRQINPTHFTYSGTLINKIWTTFVPSTGSTLVAQYHLTSSKPVIFSDGIMGQDEGINLGTGTTLNVVGTNISMSISGTVLNITHIDTPLPQEVIGIFGSGLGTGTILSVAGSRLSMTLTGSSLNIISSPDPVELIGVMGWEEGIPLGTGTTLNFTGGGINTSISGTVLNVFSSGDFNLQFFLGDGQNVISTGSISVGYSYMDVPVDCSISSWEILADATGSFTANILKSTYAGFPPVSPLAGLGQPVLVNQRKNIGTPTGVTLLSKTDVLLISVSSVSTITNATVSLRANKTATS